MVYFEALKDVINGNVLNPFLNCKFTDYIISKFEPLYLIYLAIKYPSLQLNLCILLLHNVSKSTIKEIKFSNFPNSYLYSRVLCSTP